MENNIYLDAFNKHPQQEHESRKDYFIRLSPIIGKAPLTIIGLKRMK